MTYKVIQWALGYLGTAAMKYIIKHPGLELVGVKCYGDSKVCVDAGAPCGVDDTGILAKKSEEALDPDCVIFTCGDTTMEKPFPGSMGYEFLETICRILESGKKL